MISVVYIWYVSSVVLHLSEACNLSIQCLALATHALLGRLPQDKDMSFKRLRYPSGESIQTSPKREEDLVVSIIIRETCSLEHS